MFIFCLFWDNRLFFPGLRLKNALKLAKYTTEEAANVIEHKSNRINKIPKTRIGHIGLVGAFLSFALTVKLHKDSYYLILRDML